MQRNKQRNRREGIGLALIVAFFIFLIFYLRFVSNHAEEIRRRQRGGGISSSKARILDQRHLIAEDEIEGGLGADWDALTRGATKHPETVPVVAQTEREEFRSNSHLDLTHHQPTIITSAPLPSQIRRVFHHQGATIKDHIHSRPLSPESTVPLRQASIDAADSPAVINVLLRAYENVAEHHGDDHFFTSVEHHIFSKVPEFATLLRKWQTINIEMRNGGRPARFVTVHPVGQLCNRLLAITSAAMLAILTQRGLIVDDSGFYAQSSDLFEDPGFPWVQGGGAGVGVGGHYLANPESGVWVDTEKLLCSDYAHAYPSAHVEVSSNQYLVPYMANNPHYRDSILAITRGTGDVFYPLSHFLFRPIPAIRAWRDNFVQVHFAGKFVVGLQVRSGSDFTDHFMTEQDWRLYRDCAEAVVPPNVGREVVYFLATDTEEGRTKGIALLRSGGAETRSVLVSTERFLLSNYPEGVQKALLDLLLLSASDDRVMTAWSSYGYFAAGYAGLDANLVVDQPAHELVAGVGQEQRFMGVPHKSDRRRQCVRLPTHQPCFHKFESWGASKSSCFSPSMFQREMLNGRYC